MKNSIKRVQSENLFSALSNGRILRVAKTKYFAYAAAAFMLASCSNDEDFVPQDNLKDTPITLNVTTSDLIATRAGYVDGPLTSGALSFYFTTHSSAEGPAWQESKYNATNEKWTYEEEKAGWVFESTTADTEQIVWAGDCVGKWWAVYPYQELLNATTTTLAWTVSTTQTEETWNKEDLLWAKDDNQTIEMVEITFTHALTKLTVNITGYGTEVADDEQKISSITIQGSKVAATVTPATQTWSTPTGNAADITALKMEPPYYIGTSTEQYVASYDALLIPQTAALTIVITLETGKSYSKTLNSYEFESGNAYTVTLKIGQDKVEIAEDGITATPLETMGGGELGTV